MKSILAISSLGLMLLMKILPKIPTLPMMLLPTMSLTYLTRSSGCSLKKKSNSNHFDDLFSLVDTTQRTINKYKELCNVYGSPIHVLQSCDPN